MKLILDCDPGHDDAVALIMAAKHPAITLLGVTVAAGNQTLQKTVTNACHVLQQLGREDVPVYAGMELPMVRDRIICPEIHGETGLDGPVFPPLHKHPASMHAIEYLIRTLRNSDGDVIVVTTGPMTNVATALRIAPDIAPKIARFVCMGGSMGLGNMTPAAEFNILADPEAAHIVFSCGRPVVMIGLDVTREVRVTLGRVEDYARRFAGNVAAKLFCDMMRFYCNSQKTFFGLDYGPLHDPCTIAYLLDPTLFTIEPMYVEVDIQSASSYGRTNCDCFHKSGKPENVGVATAVDEAHFFETLEACFGYYA